MCSQFGPLPPQLLNSMKPDGDPPDQGLGPYFQDGKRRVDYVLSYQVQKPASVRRKPSRFSDNALVRGLRRSLSWRRSRPAPPPRQDPELAAQENRLDYHDDDRRFRRQDFEENLMEMGLELERDEGVRTGEVQEWRGEV